MRTHLDAKAMAKSLRDSLERRKVSVSHSECLEIVARQFGVDSWNVLAASIASSQQEDDAIALRPAVPVLRIFSEEKAEEFYLDFLGFTLDWHHRFEDDLPLYAQISRSGLVLHLSAHHGDGTPGSTAYLWMTGIDAFQRELLSRPYGYARPGITDSPWARELEIADPFGNHLRFAETVARSS